MYTFLGYYNLFQAIEKYATPKQNPFEEGENEEVLRMIYKWLVIQSGKVKTVQLRIHNDSQNIMHYVGFKFTLSTSMYDVYMTYHLTRND